MGTTEGRQGQYSWRLPGDPLRVLPGEAEEPLLPEPHLAWPAEFTGQTLVSWFAVRSADSGWEQT